MIAPALRVAFITGSLAQGGAEKQLVYMAKACFTQGCDVRVYSFTCGEFYEQQLLDAGISVIHVLASNLVFRLLILMRFLYDFRPHLIQSAQLYTGIYAGVLGLLLRIPSIGSLRSNLENSRRMGWFKLWVSLRSTRALIVNSYSAYHEIKELIPQLARRTYVLYNVIDIADFDVKANAYTADNRSITAIMVGRLIPLKRVDLFLHALQHVRNNGFDIKGQVVGAGPLRSSLEALASDLKLDVEFMGHRTDIPSLLKAADMLVLCSDHEGFPNVLLEGMSARLPVISTPAGDSKIVIQVGITGYIVPFGDEQTLANRILTLLNNEGLRQRLGEAGRKRVEDVYSNQQLGKHLFEIYLGVTQLRSNDRRDEPNTTEPPHE